MNGTKQKHCGDSIANQTVCQKQGHNKYQSFQTAWFWDPDGIITESTG